MYMAPSPLSLDDALKNGSTLQLLRGGADPNTHYRDARVAIMAVAAAEETDICSINEFLKEGSAGVTATSEYPGGGGVGMRFQR